MASQMRRLRPQNTSINASAHQLRQLLRPLVKAYLLGYASSTTPRLLTLLVTLVTKQSKAGGEVTFARALLRVYQILRGGLEWQRFPSFCAALIGGTSLLQIPLGKLFASIAADASSKSRDRLTTWCASFIAGWFSMKLLQSKESDAFTDQVVGPDGVSIKSRLWAGRTMDLTLFALVRAMDVIVGELWARRKSFKVSVNRWHRSDDIIAYFTDPAVFAASCSLIMWSWIYLPEKLPRAYNKWITGAAQIDSRLIEALRKFQWGELVYGKETGQSELITSMCRDYSWPLVWGDPTKSIPLPCEIVHMGTGPSCEWHAVRRFLKGFLTAFTMYGGINSILFLMNPSVKGAKRACISSVRSSAFLGTFIALFYYGVCLARCRVGPKLIGSDAKSAQRIDGGLCIGTGCALCGWSLLLENEGRRKDIALFVAPRALATLLPRRYEMKDQWKETLTFASSAAVILTCARENPQRVRGVLGRVLASVSGH